MSSRSAPFSKVFFGLVVLALALASVLVAAPAHASTTVTVKYGPYTVPAASNGNPGKYESLRLWVRKPCTYCYLTDITPNLVYPDGRVADHHTGVMLHHAVFASMFRSDATCSGKPLGLLGQRFFATGEERTAVQLGAGYGYYVGSLDQWNMLIDLMNHSDTAQTVYVSLTFTYEPGSSNLHRVRPVWLDEDQCGDSEFTAPAGLSHTYSTWTVNVPGRAVFALGHLHPGGVSITATNTTTGREICTSWPTPHGDVIGEMSTCSGALAQLRTGDRVVLDTVYDLPAQRSDVMGIMLVYVAR